MHTNRLILFFAVLLLAACQKEFTDKSNSGPVENKPVEMLSVSPDFDWKLSHDIHFNIEHIKDDHILISSLDGNTVYYKETNLNKSVISVKLPDKIDKILLNGVIYQVNNGVASKLKSSSLLNSNELAEYLKYETSVLNNMTISIGPENTYVNNNYRFLSVISMDANRVLVAYTDNDQNNNGFVRIGSLNNGVINWGTAKKFSSGNLRYLQVLSLGNDKFVLLYSDYKKKNIGYAQIGKAGGMNPGFGNPVYFNKKATSWIAADVLDISKREFVIAYADQDGTGKCIIGENTSGPNFKFGKPVQFLSGDNYNIRITSLATDKFIVTTYSTTSRALARTGYLKGSKLVFGPAKKISKHKRQYDVCRIDDHTFTLAYADGDNNNRGVAAICDVNNYKISIGAETVFCNDQVDNPQIALFDASNIVVTYENKTNARFGELKPGTINGNALSFGNKVFYNHGSTSYSQTIALDPTHCLMAYVETEATHFGRVVIGSLEPLIADADGDGVEDSLDDYPNDPGRAYDNYYPAAGYGSLAFEDLWPGTGDYDFNDLVVDYRFQTVTNASNEVVEIFGSFVSKASGAYLNNGFGFSLPDAGSGLVSDPSNFTVSGFDLSEGYVNLNAYGHETGQSKPTMIVFDNIFNLMPHAGTALGVNTEDNQPFVEFDTLTLTITPNNIYDASDFSVSSWNPFIIVDLERSHEVHLPDYPPTDLADQSLYGVYEDNSDPTQNRYYKTQGNLPWAIDIPAEFNWPLEKQQITSAYNYFSTWAESGGQEYTDWYEDIANYRDNTKIYIISK